MSVNAEPAHTARVWDYWLGGRDHYLADREVGDRVRALYPQIAEVARADREFLVRVVRYLATTANVGQFLDIGTGLPTAQNTHEVALRAAPDARVVYVDNDPLVLAHARALLVGVPAGATAYLDADLREPEAILRGAAKTLDFGRPVAVLLLGVLNFVLDDDEAADVVDRLVDGLPPGSYLALSHPTLELGGEANEAAMGFWNAHATPPITARPRAALARLLRRLDLLPPGLVPCTHWRPTGEPAPAVAQFGAVGRKV
ncbi:SAM-dependent methyltransferase [Streptomyces marincola]|uniref:Translation initiation factor IF-2 n=1 Tax=Streptomyces marincola TaxID=2878388 RepID=A0A1W7CSW2_9ACTN|nr:SAM-dependent methyltransferase [Streptomyces marincola]ARQ67884.1 translation initiation factor IF-2 [Streptomyces marincola]